MGFLTNQVKIITYQITLIFKWIFSVVFWGLNTIVLLILRSITTIMNVLRIFVQHLPHVTAGYVSHERRKKLNQMLMYAGVKIQADEVISLTLVYSILLALITGLTSIALRLRVGSTLFIVLATFAAVWVIIFMTVNLLIYRRTESVENMLPDVLDMIAQNMITGMTAYNSLLFAARPEFGPLAHEIETAAKSTLTGTRLEDGLLGMTERVDSDKLERSINLIIQGMRSGGELPSVLQGVARDMRAERNLKKQMGAETAGYAMFILFSIIIGAPLLLAISLQFITVFTTLFEETGLNELAEKQAGFAATSSMMKISKLAISPSFFLKYAVGTLIVIAFFGSFIIGLIRTGKPISGIQNIPILIIITISLFFVFNYTLRGIFSNLIGF
jgi:Flp pilus assembly protein TadB